MKAAGPILFFFACLGCLHSATINLGVLPGMPSNWDTSPGGSDFELSNTAVTFTVPAGTSRFHVNIPGGISDLHLSTSTTSGTLSVTQNLFNSQANIGTESVFMYNNLTAGSPLVPYCTYFEITASDEFEIRPTVPIVLYLLPQPYDPDPDPPNPWDVDIIDWLPHEFPAGTDTVVHVGVPGGIDDLHITTLGSNPDDIWIIDQSLFPVSDPPWIVGDGTFNLSGAHVPFCTSFRLVTPRTISLVYTPEPSTFMLLFVGAFLAMRRKR